MIKQLSGQAFQENCLFLKQEFNDCGVQDGVPPF